MLNILEMQLLIKLRQLLQSRYLYYYFLACFLLILSLNVNFFFIILLVYLIVFKNKYHISIMIFFLSLIFLIFNNQSNIKIPSKVNNNFTIVSSKKYYNNYQYVVKDGKYKYIIKDSKQYKNSEIVFIKGDVKQFINLSSPNGFKKKDYYFKEGIYGEIVNYEITSLNKSSYLYKLTNLLNSNYLNIFSDNMDDDLDKSISNLNIFYLFSLSGIHIYFLINIINKLMFHLNFDKYIQQVVIILFILICLFLTGFKFVLLRIFIYQVLKTIKNNYYNHITNYSLINLTYFMIVLIRPYYMFNSSVLLSYLIVSFIMVFNEKINSDSKIVSTIKLAFLVNIIILPFNNNLNLVSIIINPFLIVLIAYLLFPLSIILSVFINIEILNKVYYYLINFIKSIGNNNFNITLPYLNTFFKVLFYIILIIFLITNAKKRIISFYLLILILIMPTFKKYFSDEKLYFLDVGQGDASVYISKDSVIVIDAFRSVSNLLKYEGILTIDYLIISHSDFDHLNEAETIIENFNVKNIVISYYDNVSFNFNNIIRVKAGYKIKTKDVIIEFLSPNKNYNSKNNNSLVFILSYNNNNILYTGDIYKEVEVDLISNLCNIKIDILKVAHHGSKTSSSSAFISAISPKIAVISVGIDNKYDMPSNEVIANLKQNNINVYRTDLDGTILYYNKEISFR